MTEAEYNSQKHGYNCSAFPGRYPDIGCKGCRAILAARAKAKEKGGTRD